LYHVREFPRILQRDTGRLDYILPLFVLAGTYAPGLWFCPCWLHCESDWLPAVSDPGAIFEIAITRVQEIMIGIFCAALIHRYVLPARISGQFNSKLSQTLLAARQRIAETLTGKPDPVSSPLHMALALQFLQASAIISLMILRSLYRSGKREKGFMTGLRD
jgi:hypothetical protein